MSPLVPAVEYDTGSSRTLWAAAQLQAKNRPAETVIAYAPDDDHVEEVSWDRLAEAVADLRGRLAAQGVADGRTVVLALPNGPLTVAVWLAVMANGAVAHAVDADSGSLAFERALTGTSPAMVIAHPGNVQTIHAAALATGTSARVVCLDRLTLDQRLDAIGGWERIARVPAEPDGDAVAALLPTSGTSGAPKLVQLTGHNYVIGAERLARNSGYLATDRHYVCSPFFHTNAQVYLVAPPLITGGSMAIVPRFSARRYFSDAARLGATVSSMVAPPLRMALHHVLKSGVTPGDSLRLIQYGMNLSAADWADWDRFFGTIETRQIYGQTESVSGVLGGSPWEVDDRATIGRPFIGIDAVRLVGPDGEDVVDGEPGELLVRGERGRSLMLGYHENDEATAAALDGGWLHTGDIMARQPGGRFEFRGRRMHIIRRGGENVSTYALELDLQRCSLVSDVAVTAQEDDRLDALIVAHIIPAPGYDEPAFLAWCRETLGKRGVPDIIRVHADFPRTPSGRVIVRELG